MCTGEREEWASQARRAFEGASNPFLVSRLDVAKLFDCVRLPMIIDLFVTDPTQQQEIVIFVDVFCRPFTTSRTKREDRRTDVALLGNN